MANVALWKNRELSTTAETRSSTCSKAERRRSSFDGDAMEADSRSALYECLREADTRDHRLARRMLLDTLDRDPAAVERLMPEIAGPGDGRLRQLVSSCLLRHPLAERFAPSIKTWLETESDEFARRAEAAVLAPSPDVKSRKIDRQPRFEGATELYRYLGSRMAHDIRNGLYGPRTHVAKLKRLV